MNAGNDRMGALEIFFVLAAAGIEVGVLEQPRLWAESVGRDCWLIPPLQLPLFLSVVYLLWRLGMRFPRETVYEYAPRLMGKWAAQAVYAIIMLYWLLVMGRITREFGDVVKLTLLDLTPLEVILASMLLTAAYLARHGLGAIARSATIIFIGTWIIGLAIAGLTFIGTNPVAGVLPIMARGPGPVIKEALLTFGALEQLAVLLVLFPFFKTPKKALPPILAAQAIISFTLGVVTLSTLAIFGPKELIHIRQPSLIAIQTVEQPLVLLERLSSFYVATWIAQVYITLVIMLWFAATSLQKWLGLRNHAGFVVPMLPIVYMIALSPPNVTAVDEYSRALTVAGSAIYLSLPLLLYLLAVLRGARSGGKEADVSEEGAA